MALISACTSEDDIKPIYTVGEADNVITLRAGVSTGESDVQTRATDANHDNHLALKQGTKAALRIDGTWTDHNPESVVSQTTTATIDLETSSGSKHNDVSMSPVLYWDDYGTADPTNTTGRAEGLTIYGVAVDGYKKDGNFALPSETNNNLSSISDWKALPWTLDANQTSGWAEKDLLTSNNIQAGEGHDGTLKFDDWKGNTYNTPSDLLVFTHAMSKVTVKLKAGAGFAQNKFTAVPSVILTSNIGDATTNTEWAYTKGNVDVTTKAVTDQSGSQKITMHHTNTTDGQYSAIYDALVMPGSCFGNTDNAIIARINADGNVYYVTAQQIRAKMLNLDSSTDYKTESGKNYIINVIVNKTEIKVSATVTNWTDVSSEQVSPVININVDYGTTGTGSSENFDSFSFYRSTRLAEGYSNGLTGNTEDYSISEAIAKNPTGSESQWKFYDSSNNEIHLYWPDHNTHYQFRGVWPNTSVGTDDTETVPHITHVSATDNTQKIDIRNAEYSSTQNYPSNLMIGRPEVTGNCTNTETGHTTTNLFDGGICATEGIVNLNFRYVMSQVEVVLSTSGEGSSDRVNIDANTVVEIVNVAKEGYVRLGDREVVRSDDATNSYTLDKVSGDGNDIKRHSAIVPQELAYTTAGASTNARFKITVTNTDGTKDVYYADIKPIKKIGSSDLVATNGKWESGVHYVYNLKLTKTEIKVSATITDWTRVDASDDVWM